MIHFLTPVFLISNASNISPVTNYAIVQCSNCYNNGRNRHGQIFLTRVLFFQYLPVLEFTKLQQIWGNFTNPFNAILCQVFSALTLYKNRKSYCRSSIHTKKREDGALTTSEHPTELAQG